MDNYEITYETTLKRTFSSVDRDDDLPGFVSEE